MKREEVLKKFDKLIWIDTFEGITTNNASKVYPMEEMKSDVRLIREYLTQPQPTLDSDVGKELHLKQDAIDTLIKSYAKVNSKLSQYESVIEEIPKEIAKINHSINMSSILNPKYYKAKIDGMTNVLTKLKAIEEEQNEIK